MDKVDIAIVGGGAVGLSLALALAQSTTFQICVIDPRDLSQPSTSTRSMALSFSSERFYTKLNQWQTLATSATPILQVHTSIQGHYGTTRMQAHEMGVAALGQVVGLDDLENSLLSALKKYDTVSLISKTRLTGVSDTASPIMILEQDGQPREMGAKLVIGTDGVKSQVAKSANIEYQVTQYAHQAVICHVKTSLSHRNVAYERFTQEGALAFLPFGDNQATFVWTVSEEKANELMALSTSAYLDLALTQFGYRLGKLLSATPRVTFPLVQLLAQTQWRDRVVLLGNSAHTLHPIAAQGLNLSLRDVAAFVSVIQSENLETIETEKLATQYASLIQADQARVIGFTNQIAKQMASSCVPAGLKAAALTALDACWPLKHYMTRLAMGLSG